MLKNIFFDRTAGKLHLINNWLTLVVAIFALYIIFAPLLPQATWIVQENTPLGGILDRSGKVEEAAGRPADQTAGNRLFIPALGMNELVYEGGIGQLKKGILHRGHTSTPDKGSNTVLVGHRFAYGARGVFYHLDKVKKGDELVLHWGGKRFEYTVTNILVVPPEEVSVEAPTENARLTLYTCTPLWTVTDRLVIQADLTGGEI